MAKTRVGIIGGGFAADAHVRALRLLANVDVVAVATSRVETAQEFADKHGIKSSFSNYQSLLKDQDIDVVHVCTPNALHFPIVMEFIEAGKHILCDKPLGITSAETGALFSAAKERSILHGLCSNYRHQAMVRYAKTLISEGRIGDILFVHGSYLQSSNTRKRTNTWKNDRQLVGSSYVTLDLGHHWVDLLLYLTQSNVIEVRADFRSALECPPGLENLSILTFNLAKGGTASASMSKVSYGHSNSLSIELSGSKGALSWAQMDQETLRYTDEMGSTTLVPRDPKRLGVVADRMELPTGHHEGWLSGFFDLFHRFYSHVRGETQDVDYPTFEDGHRVSCVLDTLVTSASRNGEWTSVKDGSIGCHPMGV